MSKSIMMRWAWYVACMEKTRNGYTLLVGKPAGKRLSEDVGVVGRIILKWILWKQGGWL
jgi:hypothetical protein